jgi:chromate transporter
VAGLPFCFAAYLGTVIVPEPCRLAGALPGLIGIFLPGMLVLLAALPFWSAFSGNAPAPRP